MSSLDYQFYPGRIRIDEVIVSNGVAKVDLTDLFVEADVNSFINGDTTSVEILILDSQNVFEKYKISGGDNVSITISNNDETREMFLKVISLEKVSNFDNQRGYSLRCVSHFAFLSMHAGIIKSYDGNITETARKIFDEFASEVDKAGTFEPSSNSTKAVIPNWSPLKTLNWLAGKAVWARDPVRFRFFQDSKLNYNFMPVEKGIELYKEKPAYKYTYNLIVGTKGAQQAPNSELTMRAIKKLTYENQFDLKRSMRNGNISGIVHAPDIIDKKYEKVVYNYFTNFNKENYLNAFPQFKSETYEPAVTNYDILTSFIHDGGINKENDISKIKRSNIDGTQTVIIEVVGNFLIDVGQVIELEVATPEPESELNKKTDNRVSGLYYITSKRDIYSRNEHKMYLGITKESQLESVES